MMIEEYKKAVLHELEKAGNGHEVEQIINRSVERFPEGDLYRHLVVIYLHILQNGLEELPEENEDFVKKRNIRHALNYLKQINENREKVE
jgi:hypothetical protein